MVGNSPRFLRCMIYQAQIFVTWVFIGYGVGGHRIIRDRIIRDAYAPNCVVLHVVSCLSCRVVPCRALWRYFALFSVFGGGGAVSFPPARHQVRPPARPRCRAVRRHGESHHDGGFPGSLHEDPERPLAGQRRCVLDNHPLRGSWMRCGSIPTGHQTTACFNYSEF